MKNLKKILLAFVSALLLVSMAAGLAFAVAGEENQVHQLNLTSVQKIMADEVDAAGLTANQKAAGLIKVYSLLTTLAFDTEDQGYIDFVKSYNEKALTTSLALSGELASSAELTQLISDINTFLGAVPELEFVSPSKSVYTGSVASAKAILGKINENSTNEEFKAALAELYAYLAANPVDPTTDDYKGFIDAYFAACDDLAEIFNAEINGVSDLDSKVAALTSVYNYLKETPISDTVVAAYNEIRATLIAEYAGMSDKLSANDMVIDKSAYTEESTAGIGSLLSLSIKTFRKTMADEAKTLESVMSALASLHTRIIAAKLDMTNSDSYNFVWGVDDPATEENENGYVVLRDAAVDFIMAELDATKDLDEKLALLESVRAYLVENPVSDAAYDAYNERVIALKNSCKGINDALKSEELHFVYKAPKTPSENVSYETINTLIADIENAQTNEAKLAAYAAFFNLVRVAVINDTTTAEFTAFKAKYKELADGLVTMLLAPVDAAEAPEEKLAALTAASEYLATSYFDTAVLYQFNAKLAEVVSDEATVAALTVKSDMYKANEWVKKLAEIKASGDVDAYLADYAQYNAFVAAGRFYTVEENYAEFVAADRAEYEYACNKLFAKISSAKSIEDKFAALVWVKNYLGSIVMDKATVDRYESAAAAIDTDCKDAVSVLSASEKHIISLSDRLNSLLDAVKAAEGVEARLEAFSTLFAEYKLSYTNKTREWCDTAFVEFEENYKAYLPTVADELIATVDAATTPADKYAAIVAVRDYLKNNLFSVDVIEKYTAKLDELKAVDYLAAVETVNACSQPITYVAIEGTVTDYTELMELIALVAEARNSIAEPANEGDGAATETALTKTVNAFKAVYAYLAANKLDVFAESVIAVIDAYDAAKATVIADLKADMLNSWSGDVTAAVAAYTYAYNLLKDDAMSVSFANMYNETRNGADCFSGFEAAFTEYKTKLAEIETYVNSALIFEAYADDAQLVLANQANEAFFALIDRRVQAHAVSYDIAEFTDADKALIKKNAQIDRINSILKKYSITPATYVKVEERRLDLAALTAQAKKDLEDQTNLVEYEWMQTDTKDLTTGSSPASIYNSDKTKDRSYLEMATDPLTGNRYMNIVANAETDFYVEFKLWKLLSGSSASSISKAPELAGLTRKGFVMEFDMLISENAQFAFSSTEDALDKAFEKNGSRTGVYHWGVKNAGNLHAKTTGGVLQATEAFTPGEWSHVVCVFEPIRGTQNAICTMYVNYAFAGSWTTASTVADTYDLTVMRIRMEKNYTSLGIDNLTLYQGTNYRTKGRFDTMNDASLFKFYAEYAADENRTAENRAYAYNQATAYLAAAKSNPALATYVEMYESVDYDRDLLSIVREDKMTQLFALAEKFDTDKIKITASNYNGILVSVDDTEQFITENSIYLDQTNPEFVRIRTMITEVKNTAARVANFKVLVAALEKFQRATTVDSMEKHYAVVTEAYNACAFKEGNNYEMAMTDEVILKFLKSVRPDGTLTLNYYYETYAIEKINNQRLVENSVRIIKCVKAIEDMEGYLPNETFWAANYDYIEGYLSVIRALVQVNNYDATYEGIDEALVHFEEIEAYFYQLVQVKHRGVIEEQLQRFPTCRTYIEKKGICTYVENYIIDNDINQNDEVFAALIRTLEAYKLEVQQYESEYADVLEANTVTFIGIVAKMDSYATYNEIKPLYDEAIANYYYNMNVDSAEAKAALERFAEHEARIEFAETNSYALIEAVDELKKARTKTQIYNALVECTKYAANSETDIAGVSAALRTYEEKLNEYNAEIDVLNAEINEANGVVCSARGVSVSSVVLAIINAIFTR